MIFERLTLCQHGAEHVHRFFEDAIGLAFVHLEWTNAVDHLVHDVPEVQSVEHSHSEIDGELEAGLTRSRLHTIVLLEQQYAEAIEAGILECEAILGYIHPET